MKLHFFVQCHICPIKWICEYSADNESYKWHQEVYYGPDKKEQLSKAEHEKLEMATNLCPLRKKVFEK